MSAQLLIAFKDETTCLVGEGTAEDILYFDYKRGLDMVFRSSISAAKVVKMGWTAGKLARLPKDYDQWCEVQLAGDY